MIHEKDESPLEGLGIFSTQESNRGSPDCRLILYRLSYQGSSTIKCIITLDVLSSLLSFLLDW